MSLTFYWVVGNVWTIGGNKEKLLDSSKGGIRYKDFPITARYCLSIPPENIRKPLGFLMFLRGIDKQHMAEIG